MNTNTKRRAASVSKIVLSALSLAFMVGATLVATSANGGARRVQLAPAPNRPIIFFDLGDVLINTSDWDNLRYMPGAEDYLRDLYQGRFAIGLITNVPEDWGRTDPEKLERLKQEIEKTWREPKPFPWQIFSYVVFPPSNRLRKPHPRMFEMAMDYAGECRPVFEGETPVEIDVAREIGFYTFIVHRPGHDLFLPIEDMRCQRRGRR